MAMLHVSTGWSIKREKTRHTRRVGVLELVLERLSLAMGKRLDESQGLGQKVSIPSQG